MPHKEERPPRGPHGKPPRAEKHRRRRTPVLPVLVLLLIVLIALLVYFKPFGGGFGFGGGGETNGSPESGGASDSADISDSSDIGNSGIAVIRIDGNDIFLDGEQCESADALKDRITAVGTQKEYKVDHSTAIKSTYDEVKQVLSGLENALDIKVDYNE